MRLVNIVFITWILFSFSFCENPISNDCEDQIIKRDSIIKKIILDNYGIPITITERYFDVDSLNIDRLLSDIDYQNFSYRTQLDSIVLDSSIFRLLPKYKPAYRNDRRYNILRFVVDNSSFGNREIEIYEIECEKQNCYLSWGVVSIDSKCYGRNMTIPFSSNCYAFEGNGRIILTRFQSKAIFSIYNESDIGRIAYYDHQSRLICDGISISIRRINNYEDKTTIIDCPGSMNPVLEMHSEIKNLIRK